MNRPVEVIWLDSVQSTIWEQPDDAIRDAGKETMRCHSLGYVLADTSAFLLLTMSYLESGSVHAPLQIPKAAVVSVTEVMPVKDGPYIGGDSR